jgi:hypothetical protein
MRNLETQLGEKQESVHCIAMLIPHINFINKPTVSKEYPANTTQTGSLMFGVEESSEDCGLGRITSQGQSREFSGFLTPCLAPPCKLLGPKSEWHQKWDEFIH